MRYASLLAAALLLTACAADEDTARYLLEPVTDGIKVRPAVNSVEVREVSLPEYAASIEVFFQTADGALRSSTIELWADQPERSVTGALVRDIGEITGVTAAAEPWPLQEFPDVRLEVRISRMYAGVDGQFVLSGQYFVTPQSGPGREQVRNFDLALPLAGEGYPAIAETTSRALRALAVQISREALAR